MKDNSAYKHFTTKEIKPRGWLLRQLRLQADGLSGCLDKVWPDIGASKWVGGEADGWERMPYWLDGFIPLAYILDDAELKARADKYVDIIINNQREDGWICPCEDERRSQYDLWAGFLMCKVLVVYYECTGDERIQDVLYKALSCFKIHLRGRTLFGWANSRWYECLIPIYWLYDRVQESWLKELCVTIASYGFNYRDWIDNFCYTECVHEWKFQTHIVNMHMALRAYALFSRVTGEDPQDYAWRIYNTLFKYHGSALGYITGDECLAGRSPIQGTELCGLAEGMYSFEKLFEISGNPAWLDKLELFAFNSFPATNSEDMWTHQYLQLVNQLSCPYQQLPVIHTACSPEGSMFGFEPNFGCCTANFSQAWPMFALSTFYYNDKRIISAVPVPSSVSTVFDGSAVKIKLDTDYPFKGRLEYTVTTDSPVRFEFAIRIPDGVSSVCVDGNIINVKDNIYVIDHEWNGTEKIVVELDFDIKIKPWDNDMYYLQRGNLCFSVPIEYKEVRTQRTKAIPHVEPYPDMEFYPIGEWEYAFASDEFVVHEHDVADMPFSRKNPAITITTKMAKIDWGTIEDRGGICLAEPRDRTPVSYRDVTMQPYGNTYLRMTVIPKVNK